MRRVGDIKLTTQVVAASGWRYRTAYVAGAILLTTASLVLTKTGRDALYFEAGGLFDLPFAYIGIAVLSAPTALLALRFMRWLGSRGARVASPVVTALGLAWFASVARPGGGLVMTALFMLVPLAYGVTFSLSWLLAADLLDGQSERELGDAYAIIGGSAIGGGILGGLAARGLASIIPPASLITVGAALLVASAVVMWMAHQRFPLNMRAQSEMEVARSPGAVRAVMRRPYVLILLGIAVTSSVAGILVEFQFYLVAAASDNSAGENVVFFADLYTLLNVGALLVQLFLVPRLQRAIGVVGSLAILPAALVGGAAALVIVPSAVMRAGIRAAEGGLKSSIHRSNWEQAFIPISRTGRSVAKLIIDGTGTRMGEGVAALALLVWLHNVTDETLPVVSVLPLVVVMFGAAVGWLFLLRRLARSYQPGLLTTGESPGIPMPDS